MNFRDLLAFHVKDAWEEECELCGHPRWCLLSEVHYLEECRLSLLACGPCHAALFKESYEPAFAKFLKLLLTAVVKLTKDDVEDEKREEARMLREKTGFPQRWNEAAGLLYRVLGGAQALANKIALSKVVSALTKADPMESVRLLDQAFTAEAAKSPAAPVGGAWLDAVKRLHTMIEGKQGAAAHKIGVIRVLRELTGLGLKETKDLVEAAGFLQSTPMLPHTNGKAAVGP